MKNAYGHKTEGILSDTSFNVDMTLIDVFLYNVD